MNNNQWPNFFIIGEPRSGTTSLHDLLSRHPEIFMSKAKEPHYFSRLKFKSPDKEIHKITRNEKLYSELFLGSGDYPIRGESSTYYLADPESPKLIKKSVPKAKMIAILRDPVERAYSHYLLYNRRGKQKLSFYETIQKNLRQSNGRDDLMENLVELGYYHEHLKNYYKHFNKKQILVLLFEDTYKNPRQSLKQIFEFLGVDISQAESIKSDKPKNSYSRPRSKLAALLLSSRLVIKIGHKLLPTSLLRQIRYKVLLKADKKPPMDPKAKKLLEEIYAPEIEKLEKLLGRDLSSLRRTWDKD